MSGGAFNYLFLADGAELFQRRNDLEQIAITLEQWGDVPDVVRVTRAVLARVEQAQDHVEDQTQVERAAQEIDALAERVRGVWYAVEWLESGDGNERDVQAALRDFRAQHVLTAGTEQAHVGADAVPAEA